MPKKAAVLLMKNGVQKMAPSERANVEAQLAQITDDLDGKEKRSGEDNARPDLIQDKFVLIAKKKKLEEILNKDDDLKAKNGGDRDRQQSEINELQELIRNGQLSAREEALMPKNSQDFEAAVKKQIAHQKAQLTRIQRWQQLKRMQEPENPMADNVALLRETKTVVRRGRPSKTAD